jgi:hypothetical protein
MSGKVLKIPPPQSRNIFSSASDFTLIFRLCNGPSRFIVATENIEGRKLIYCSTFKRGKG